MPDAKPVQHQEGPGKGFKALRFALALKAEYVEAWGLFSRNARLFLMGNLLLGVGTNLVNLLFNLYLKGLSMNEASIGAVLSTRALGSMLVSIPASFVVARLNPRLLLRSATVLTATAYLAQTLFQDLDAISASVLMAGAFSTIYTVASGPFIMRNSGERERVHFFSLNSALSFGTGVIGSLLGGFFKEGLRAFIPDEILCYRLALLGGVAFVLSALVPFSRIRASDELKPPEEAPAGKTGSVAKLFGIRSRVEPALYLKLLIPGFFVGMGAGLTIPYINLYFKSDFGMVDGLIGVVVALGQVFTFVGMAAGPAVARRISKPRAVFVTQAISVPFILVLTYARWMPLVWLAYLARQTLMNMSTPLQDNFALELVPRDQQHLMNALKSLNWTGSWMIAARISGEVITRWGYSPSFTLTAIFYAISTFLFWFFFLRKGAARLSPPGTPSLGTPPVGTQPFKTPSPGAQLQGADPAEE